jgi:hypothetical protein
LNSSDPSFESVQGVWKGFYGTEFEIKEITIRINLENKAEIFDGGIDASKKINGTYLLLGDSAIIISSLTPNSRSTEIILNGNLNRTASFISGDWDGSHNEKGCFYLQKLHSN